MVIFVSENLDVMLKNDLYTCYMTCYIASNWDNLLQKIIYHEKTLYTLQRFDQQLYLKWVWGKSLPLVLNIGLNLEK